MTVFLFFFIPLTYLLGCAHIFDWVTLGAIGSVHENGTGSFQVLDRFLADDGKTVMLKIEWLTTGQTEINKEVNVSASVWKFEQKHGISKKVIPDVIEPVIEPVKDKLKVTFMTPHFVKAMEDRKLFSSKLEEISVILHDQQRIIADLMVLVTANQDAIQQLVRDRELMNKLIEKL